MCGRAVGRRGGGRTGALGTPKRKKRAAARPPDDADATSTQRPKRRRATTPPRHTPLGPSKRPPLILPNHAEAPTRQGGQLTPAARSHAIEAGTVEKRERKRPLPIAALPASSGQTTGRFQIMITPGRLEASTGSRDRRCCVWRAGEKAEGGEPPSHFLRGPLRGPSDTCGARGAFEGPSSPHAAARWRRADASARLGTLAKGGSLSLF